MSDLTERLRTMADDMETMDLWPRPRSDVRQAADRIDELEDEVQRLSWLKMCVQRAIDKGEYLGYGIDEAMEATP